MLHRELTKKEAKTLEKIVKKSGFKTEVVEFKKDYYVLVRGKY